MLEKEVEARGLRWEDRGLIIIDALSTHYMEGNAGLMEERMIKFFEDHPSILDPVIKKLRLEIRSEDS
jgi:hypothetical protein